MARKRASMREGPLAELFKATEAAQRQAEEAARQGGTPPEEPHEATVEHVPTWEDTSGAAVHAPPPEPEPSRPSPRRRSLSPRLHRPHPRRLSPSRAMCRSSRPRPSRRR